MDFCEEIIKCYDQEDDTSNPRSKDELLKRYGEQLLYHKTFINNELFSVPIKDYKNRYINIPENFRMITVCCLIMFSIDKSYRISVHVSETSFFGNCLAKKGFELVGIIKDTNYKEEGISFIKNAIPIWPNRNIKKGRVN